MITLDRLLGIFKLKLNRIIDTELSLHEDLNLPDASLYIAFLRVKYYFLSVSCLSKLYFNYLAINLT